MDHVLTRVKCAQHLSMALSLVFEASEYAREARLLKLVTELEHLAEDLIHHHRDVLELPPQSSTALASEEDGLPF